jgi:hypothetical protein
VCYGKSCSLLRLPSAKKEIDPCESREQAAAIEEWQTGQVRGRPLQKAQGGQPARGGGTRLRNSCGRVVDASRIPPPRSMARKILPASYCSIKISCRNSRQPHDYNRPPGRGDPHSASNRPGTPPGAQSAAARNSQARRDLHTACLVAEHCLESNVELNVDVGLVLRFGFAAPKV